MSPIFTVIPFAAYPSTTAWTVLPTGCFSTNPRYGITALIIFSRAPGGGVFGTGIGLRASGLGVCSFATTLPVRTALRLVSPRAGTRLTNTQPTWGTGLPPMSLPSSKSHLYLPWNSWKLSFERIVALAFSAMARMNASPRPMAPAGGATSSLCSIALLNSATSFLAIRWPNVASTTTVILALGYSLMKAVTASCSWARLGVERPSVAMLEPSTMMCLVTPTVNRPTACFCGTRPV